jgi:hypothetical protein
MLHSLLQFSPEEMTYKELLQQLQQLNEEQLNQDVAICSEDDEDEYYQASVELVFATDECQVLDVDHPIIRF